MPVPEQIAEQLRRNAAPFPFYDAQTTEKDDWRTAVTGYTVGGWFTPVPYNPNYNDPYAYRRDAQGRTGFGDRTFPGGQDAADQWYLDQFLAGLEPDGSGGGGRGRGGGGGGPEYIAPDKRLIQDWVKDKSIVLLGKSSAQQDAWVKAYMSAHKKQFEGKSIDPQAEVTDKIRNTSEYKKIHGFRKDDVDEDTWVSERREMLVRLGVSDQLAGERAIDLATVGANTSKIKTGKFLTGKGIQDVGLMNDLKRSAKMVAGIL